MASAWDEDKLAGLWGRAKTNRLVASGELRPYHTSSDGRLYFAAADVMRHYAYKQPDRPSVGCCACCGHGCEPTAYQAAAAGGVIVKALSANAQKLLDALDRLGGDHINLVRLRPAAALGGSFDSALNELRRAGLVGMAAMEGRYGTSQAERDAALREHGELLLFASRKDYESDIADEDYPQYYLEGGDDRGDEDEADYEESVEDEDEDEADNPEPDFVDEGELNEPGDGGEVDDLGGAALADYHDVRRKQLADEGRWLAALERQVGAWALQSQATGLAAGRLRLHQAALRWLGG
jgi:hypothetical protein